ncbi:uncharacterized protein BP5553_00222 [Venustampulla echinocandica]|uniref:Gag1-like clamp domain-containing protein n=1 Tax=Venustampulla echinocandica TaxID=2656787 RepID=A0A370TXK2_9HELO|nr:uncharacterized protein BP5553_00222 [Venustampulla echinocandica]RDL40243.1 hypothetical protein BP5553_00222 [Venustampulla echinocandica]
MVFGPVPGTSAHRRRSMANTSAITNYEADLTSRDRAKQKDAVKRYLAENVKDDWKWEWPRPETDSTSQHTSPHEENDLRWKERDEWISDASDVEAASVISASKNKLEKQDSKMVNSPFRFENPDEVGETIKRGELDRKRRRKRRLREEMAWSDGLRCFVERRDAWTGARQVPRPSADPEKRASLSSGDGSSTAIENDDEDEWEDDDTEIPIAPPLLPPANAMRASIKPDAYNTIYDKVILQQLTPTCPMNLKDVTRACVQGWKRDGEWPPKAGPIEPPAAKKKKARRLSVAGIFGLEKDKVREEAKEKTEKSKERDPVMGNRGGIRGSLQRILSRSKETAPKAEQVVAPG